jgi:predicted dithiol-disulfide oxidoreductase (DUF899 family)
VITSHRVVSHDEWIAARTQFLRKEKEFTRLRDQIGRERRDLPWERVDKPYAFEGPNGTETLPELFDGRSQLVVYHFMFAPDWEAGCPHCSHWADNFNGIIVHLNHRDVTMVAVSRAPYPKLAAYQKRMGWTFTWRSSFQSDFNDEYQASFRPEAVAKGAALCNYTVQDPGETDREGSASSTRIRRARCFTPIPRTRGASTC